jgi:hypothetical protein
MKRTGTTDRYTASPASSTATAAGDKDAQASALEDSKTTHGKATVYSKPASSTGQSLLAECKPGGERREQYIERGQQPSFEFADIEDEQVLRVEAALRTATQNVQAGRQLPTEETRRLSGIAAAIQKMMEGEVASVLRELAQIPLTDGAGLAALQDAKKSYSLFIQQFQQAKLAAANGNRSDMTDALTLALGELASLAGRHGERSTRQARAPRVFSAAVQASLRTLADACSGWAGTDKPLFRPGTASARAEFDSPLSDSTEVRARSASSPAQAKKTQERERGRSASGQTPSHKKPQVGSPPAERLASLDQIAPPKSPTSPGRKLRSLFSRTSDARTRVPGADNDPGSPRSRAAAKNSAETSTASTTEVRVRSPSRGEQKRDIDE